MEVIQENIVVIGGAIALVVVLLVVFMIIRKKRKNAGEQAEFVVPSKESVEPAHEADVAIEVDESEEDEYVPEKELLSLRKVSKGRNFFSIHLSPLEDHIHIRAIEPLTNNYGEVFEAEKLYSREYHQRKPMSIHFDYNARGVKSDNVHFEMIISYRDADSSHWNQRFIFDKSGECRLLKPRRA